jgi:sulfate permease, SulP family
VPIPEQLVVLVVSTLIVALSGVDVPKVKDIPEGLYAPKLPNFDDVGVLIQPALVCSIITYILTVNVTKALGNNYGYEIDADQEFIANAICALVGGVTGSYLPSGSFSRSALVGEISGPDGTALHNFFSTLMIVIVLLFATPLLYHMPRAIMASIIFAALKNMITFQTARRLFTVSKVDFTLWCIAFVFTSLLGVTGGIVISIVMSMLLLIKYQARPAARVLGVLKGTSDFCVDIKQFPDAQEIEGVKIFEFTAPLHFANKDHFEAKIKKMEVRSQWKNLHVVVIDCSSVTGIDITCIKMLERLQARYTAMNVELIFANWRGRDMRTLIDASGLYDTIDSKKFFLDMRSALQYAKKFVETAKNKAAAAATDSPLLGAVSSDGMEIVPLKINESAV